MAGLLSLVAIPSTALATHSFGGCIPTSANPADLNEFDAGGNNYYLEERGNPLGTSPPIPGSGASGGGGTWLYQETNGIPGLQRGGTGLTGYEDPISDETCGHGPDAIVAGTHPREHGPAIGAAPETCGGFGFGVCAVRADVRWDCPIIYIPRNPGPYDPFGPGGDPCDPLRNLGIPPVVAGGSSADCEKALVLGIPPDCSGEDLPGIIPVIVGAIILVGIDVDVGYNQKEGWNFKISWDCC